MTNQAENQPQSTISGENSALRPSGSSGRGGDAAPLIHNMIDDYLDASRILKGIDRDEDPWRYEELDSFLKSRKDEIADYVQMSLEGEALAVDSRLSDRAAGDLEKYSQLYTEREIKLVRGQRIKAMTTQVLKQVMNGTMFSKNPGHITIENEAEPDSELTIAYVDVVKGGFKASAKALRKIRDAAIIHSEEITLPPSQSHFVDEELLNDPQHAEEMTLAFNLKTIKPEDLRV